MELTYRELDDLIERLSSVQAEPYYPDHDDLLYLSENIDTFWPFLLYSAECCHPRSAEEAEKRTDMRKVLYKYIRVSDE